MKNKLLLVALLAVVLFGFSNTANALTDSEKQAVTSIQQQVTQIQQQITQITAKIGRMSDTFIVFNSPSTGNERWQIGQTYTIKWQTVNITTGGAYNLNLVSVPSNRVILIANPDTTVNTYSWRIPSTVVAGSYKLTIGLGTANIFSSNTFNIVNSGSMTTAGSIGISLRQPADDIQTLVDQVGAGVSQIQTKLGSILPTHLQCVNQKCVATEGASANQCVSDSNCVVVCEPSWQIGLWGACSTSGQQTRAVTDINNCGVLTGKPQNQQNCSINTIILNCNTLAKSITKFVNLNGTVLSTNSKYRSDYDVDKNNKIDSSDVFAVGYAASISDTASCTNYLSPVGYVAPSNNVSLIDMESQIASIADAIAKLAAQMGMSLR